jgi:2-dehydropantoate 2-reductase
MLKNKKIAIVGIGGVGGYLAGMIGTVFPHTTLVARAGRGESIKENGLVLHSEYSGEIVMRPEKVLDTSKKLEPQDCIFVCVKNYSLEQACEELKDCITDNTVIVPVMNGVDPGERTRKYLGKGIVVDSLIYIVAFANDDYSITQQGKYANLRIGLMDAKTEKEKEAVALVSAILKEADVDHLVSDDIERDIWRKYILNCAYNVETAYYDNNIGQLRADPIKAKEHELLVQEAYQVALKKGVHVQQSDVDAIIHRFYKELQDGATSSLQRDIRAGKQAEVDTFSGYIVREAKKLQVEAPVSEKMYEGLKEKTKQ